MTLVVKKQIELHGKQIEYTLKISSRARRVHLAIYGDGNFVVTTPRNVSESIIEQFIIKKSRWILKKIEYFKRIPGPVLPKSTRKDYLERKGQALVLVKTRIEHFNSFYGFKFNRISIRNQKTRWGSCSRRGNLNFNYRIVFLPEKLSDYIIIHELCHLGELNHSQKFWNLVAKVMPDHWGVRKELRKSGIRFR